MTTSQAELCRPLGAHLTRVSFLFAKISRLASSPSFRREIERRANVRGLTIRELSCRTAHWGRLRLACDGGSVQIAFDFEQFPSLAIATSVGQNEVADSHSSIMRDAVATLLIRPALERLAQLGISGTKLALLERRGNGGTVQLENDEGATRVALEVDGHAIEFDIEGAHDKVLGRLQAACRASAPSDSLPHCLARLRVPGFALLGVEHLTSSTLRSLRSGDVLLSTSATPAIVSALTDITAPVPLEVGWGRSGTACVRASATLEHTRILITGDPQMAEESYEALMNATAEGAAPDMAEFEIPVRLEVETVHLTLKQLSTLAPGYVMELPVALADSRIRLVAYGQTVGSGELVAIGEQLGVRILRIGAAPDAAE